MVTGSWVYVESKGLTVWSNPTDKLLIVQIAEEVNAGSDRKVSECTVHRSLLRIGLRSCRSVRVPMLTPVHHQKRQQWACEHQKWTTEQWK